MKSKQCRSCYRVQTKPDGGWLVMPTTETMPAAEQVFCPRLECQQAKKMLDLQDQFIARR